MKTTRRSFLSLLPGLGAMLGLRASARPVSNPVSLQPKTIQRWQKRHPVTLLEAGEEVAAGHLLIIAADGKVVRAFQNEGRVIGLALHSAEPGGQVQVHFLH